jgi:hypothetical protein
MEGNFVEPIGYLLTVRTCPTRSSLYLGCSYPYVCASPAPLYSLSMRFLRSVSYSLFPTVLFPRFPHFRIRFCILYWNSLLYTFTISGRASFYRFVSHSCFVSCALILCTSLVLTFRRLRPYITTGAYRMCTCVAP